MISINKRAYAKINLHLDMVSKRSDGYHEVRTVMQSVSLFDDVNISVSEGEGIELFCNIEGVPLDAKNLAWRAAELLLNKYGQKKRVSIRIDKRIPMAGGLAGGSADAAAVLLGLNQLLGSEVSRDELLLMGGALGADVPFCMEGGTRFADGRGDILHPFPPLCDCYIVVSQGGEGASTPWAYGELDRKYGDFADGAYSPKDLEPLRDALGAEDLGGISAELYNIFESVVIPQRPVAAAIKQAMLDSGARGAMMSGSGTSVFGLFDNEERAAFAVSKIEELGYAAHLCRPVNV